MFYENRLGIKKSVISFVYLFCPNTGTKFCELYHLNHVIPHRVRKEQSGLRARVGRPQTSSSPPVIFIAGRPKAALLFWFFGDFRCGALLFMVIHVIYKYKNR